MAVSFPKIWTIGTPQTSRLFLGLVEVTEKIDGSQFNFGLSDHGELILRSKGAAQSPATPDKLFRSVVDWVMSIQNKLPIGWMFHGETLCSPRHNTLEYARVPRNHFMLYGMSQGQHFVSEFKYLREWAEKLDCETVPLLGYVEAPLGLQQSVIDEFMDRESSLGGCKPEGFVVKNYAEQYLLGGQLIPLLMGKFVSEQFKEQHKVAWKSNGDELDAIKQSFRTEARWLKAVQHLRERGELQQAPQDIGPLMKELTQDFLVECEEEVKRMLWNHFKKDFTRVVVGGFPEWYKTKLALGEIK